MNIVVCGSMSFVSEMMLAQKELEELGHHVHLPPNIEKYLRTSVPSSEKSTEKIAYDIFRYYHDLIQESDAVLVLNHKKNNIEGYVGANALIEMVFAHLHQKKVFLLNPVPEVAHKEEILATHPLVLEGDLKRLG